MVKSFDKKGPKKETKKKGKIYRTKKNRNIHDSFRLILKSKSLSFNLSLCFEDSRTTVLNGGLLSTNSTIKTKQAKTNLSFRFKDKRRQKAEPERYNLNFHLVC